MEEFKDFVKKTDIIYVNTTNGTIGFNDLLADIISLRLSRGMSNPSSTEIGVKKDKGAVYSSLNDLIAIANHGDDNLNYQVVKDSFPLYTVGQGDQILSDQINKIILMRNDLGNNIGCINCSTKCSITCSAVCGMNCTGNCSKSCDKEACTHSCSKACTTGCTNACEGCGSGCQYDGSTCSNSCDRAGNSSCSTSCTKAGNSSCSNNCSKAGNSSCSTSCSKAGNSSCGDACRRASNSSCSGVCQRALDNTCSNLCSRNQNSSCSSACMRNGNVCQVNCGGTNPHPKASSASSYNAAAPQKIYINQDDVNSLLGV